MGRVACGVAMVVMAWGCAPPTSSADVDPDSGGDATTSPSLPDRGDSGESSSTPPDGGSSDDGDASSGSSGDDLPDDETTGGAEPEEEDGPGVFVAVGYSLRRVRSVDGREWTHDVHNGIEDVSKPNLLRGIGAGPDGLIAIGTNKAYLSTDGIDWTYTEPPGGYLGDIVHGNDVWVAAGNAGRVVRTFDGVTWEDPLTVSMNTSFRGIAFGGGYFVAIGDDGVRARSTDGVSWDAVTTDTGMLTAAAFGGGRFVAVGDGSRRLASDDAAAWGDDVSGHPAVGLRAILYHDDRFWAFGGALFVSETGEADSWEEHDLPGYFTGVAYGDGRFVAVGSQEAYVSENGYDWEEIPVPGPAFWGVAFLRDGEVD